MDTTTKPSNTGSLRLPTKRSSVGKVGRPRKLNREIIATVVDALKKCNTQKSAAASAGLAEKTYYNYVNHGLEVRDAILEDEDITLTEFDELALLFVVEIENAEHEVKNRLLERIDEAGKVRWQANAWILERRFPEEFALKSTRPEVRIDEVKKFTVKIGEAPKGSLEAIEAEYEIEE